MDLMSKINFLLDEMEKLNLIVYSENPENDELIESFKNVMILKDRDKFPINNSSEDQLTNIKIKFDEISSLFSLVFINNFQKFKNFLTKSEKFSSIIFISKNESFEKILSKLKSVRGKERIVRIFGIEFDREDEGKYGSLKEKDVDYKSHFVKIIKTKNIESSIYEILNEVKIRIIENNKRKKYLLSDNIYKNSKFLFFENECDLSKYFELQAFKYLINSDKIKSENFFKEIENEITTQKNYEISELILKKDSNFYKTIQENLRSLNYEKIFIIRGVLKNLLNNLKNESQKSDSFDGEKFFFKINLSVKEIVEIVKNLERNILLKDFTITSSQEKLEDIYNIDKSSKNSNSEENIKYNTYPTVFSINLKNSGKDLNYQNFSIIKNSTTDQKFCIIFPLSLLKIEKISIEHETDLELNLSKPFIKIESTLINESEIFKENKQMNIYNTYCDNINQVLYSEEILYLMDFILMIRERNEYKHTIENILAANSFKLKSNNLIHFDYFLLGKVYNYLGDFLKSNINFKRSIICLNKIDMKSEHNHIKRFTDMAQAFIKLNTIYLNFVDQANYSEAGKLIQEELNIFNDDNNDINSIIYNKAIIELIDKFEVIDVITAEALGKKLSKYLENDDNINDKDNNLLIKLFCMSNNNSNQASIFYKKITLNKTVPNTYYNKFIGAIHLNIVSGLQSNHSYYKFNCIEGYCDSTVFNQHFNVSNQENSLVKIDKELTINNSLTKVHNKKVTIIIPEGLSYYTCYYDNSKPTILNENISIKIFPHTEIEVMENNVYVIKKNTILDKLSLISLDTFRSRNFLHQKNFCYPFQTEVDIVDNSRNLMEIINQLFFLVSSFNKLRGDEFEIYENLRIEIKKKLKIFLDRIAFLISLPQFDLLKIIQSFKESQIDQKEKEDSSISENKKLLNSIYVLFKTTVKISMDILNINKISSIDMEKSKTIEFLQKKLSTFNENKITKNFNDSKKIKLRSPYLKKLFEGSISLNEYICRIRDKFGKRDVIAIFLLRSFLIKFLNNLINKNILSNNLTESENILYKHVDYLRCDGKNSINIFLYQKIIRILKSKQKISDLNIKEIKNNFDDTKTFSGLKIKCEYNNLQEEFLDLFKLLQENLSYFLMSNSKMKFKNLLKVIIHQLFNNSNFRKRNENEKITEIFI